MSPEDEKEHQLVRAEAGIYKALAETAMHRLPPGVAFTLIEAFRAKAMPKFPTSSFGPNAAERIERILDDMQKMFPPQSRR